MRSQHRHWMLGGLLVISLATLGPVAASAADFVDLLLAPGPTVAGPTANLYDGLIGDWDAEVIDHLPSGDRRQSAEMHFSWVLEGRAIQDLWIVPAHGDRTAPAAAAPSAGAPVVNRYGTTLRVYDAKLDAWRITWWNPVTGVENRLVGRRVGSQIVQTGADADGRLIRWVFVELTADRFHWRGERSEDGGKTWTCDTEYVARRRGSSTQAGETPKSVPAFAQLAKSLVGRWNGVEGTDATLTYTLTAGDSALMEELQPAKGPAMITMFVVDGDRLVATHYCSAGNQPQMTTETITDPQAKRLAFALTRVTGMETPRDWHNTGLVLAVDGDRLTQDWTYLSNGEAGARTFRFTRAR